MSSQAQGVQFDLSQAIQLLKGTPDTLRALLGDLSPEWLHFQEDPEAWSPHTVVIHYVHNERTNWIPRARVVLSEEDDREFPPFRQLPESGELANRSIGDLLAEFAELRDESIAILSRFKLKPSDYDRQAVHAVLGTVNLRQLLATWVVHDLNHVHQIVKSLAKRYQDAVGPWRQNLAILDI